MFENLEADDVGVEGIEEFEEGIELGNSLLKAIDVVSHYLHPPLLFVSTTRGGSTKKMYIVRFWTVEIRENKSV